MLPALLVVALDPFDSGRFALFRKPGYVKFHPTLAGASLGRDPNFDSAVIGNSHAQLLEPARLSAGTGLRFVSLAMPGTGPLEQIAAARWFALHHRAHIGALVFVLDFHWCRTDPGLEAQFPFPFWLYDPDGLIYLRGVVSLHSLESLPRRVLYLLGLEPRRRPDGYDSFEPGRIWRAEEVRRRIAEHGRLRIAEPGPDGPPAKARLKLLLAELPRKARLVFVFPPVHADVLPAGRDLDAFRACKAAYAQLAAESGAAFRDWSLDSDLARRDESFWDATHYRGAVARLLESEIVAALRGTPAPPAPAQLRAGWDVRTGSK